MKIEKKYLIAGLIGIVTIAGAFAYLQYKKLMNYVIKVKNVVIKSANIDSINFDLFLNFENKSSVAFEILSQSYDVYINNSLISKLKGKQVVKIAPKSVSVIPLKVNIKPSDILNKLGKDALNLIANFGNNRLKVNVKLQVKLYGFTFNIPYVYETTISELKKGK
jgi:LEA14-like dessication related protein